MPHKRVRINIAKLVGDECYNSSLNLENQILSRKAIRKTYFPNIINICNLLKLSFRSTIKITY
jgi:hypothetical protein